MYELDTEKRYTLSAEAKKRTYVTQISVTTEQLEDIIVTAVELGISYWAVLNDSNEIWNERPDGMPASKYVTQLLLSDKSVEFYDKEDNSERLELNLDKLLNGIGLYLSESETEPLDAIHYIAADSIIQYALFGDVVYYKETTIDALHFL